MSFLQKLLDERFFAHRQRSTSIAGIVGAVLSVVLFEYRLVVNHVWSWDLLAVTMTFVGIKLAAMTYFYLRD